MTFPVSRKKNVGEPISFLLGKVEVYPSSLRFWIGKTEGPPHYYSEPERKVDFVTFFQLQFSLMCLLDEHHLFFLVLPVKKEAVHSTVSPF